MTRIDEKIDFNWGFGAIIPNSAKDFVSIHWSGYLRVPYTEVYFFEVSPLKFVFIGLSHINSHNIFIFLHVQNVASR